MTELLQLPQLIDKHCMTEVQVGRSGIEPGFHAQWPAGLEPFRQLGSYQSSSQPRSMTCNCSSTFMPGGVYFTMRKERFDGRGILLSFPHPGKIQGNHTGGQDSDSNAKARAADGA